MILIPIRFLMFLICTDFAGTSLELLTVGVGMFAMADFMKNCLP
jgi:hypothetical protein